MTPFRFEQLLDQLEKNSGNQAVSFNEAKSLMKEFNADNFKALYDYWLNKRKKLVRRHGLTCHDKGEITLLQSLDTKGKCEKWFIQSILMKGSRESRLATDCQLTFERYCKRYGLQLI